MVSKRSTLILLVIFIGLYWFRFQAVNKKDITSFVELNSNSYLKINGYIDTIPVEKQNNWNFKVNGIWIRVDKTSLENKNFYYQIGDRLLIIGKPQIRVINKFFKEIWLINPQIKFFKNENNDINFGPFHLKLLLIKPLKIIYFIRQEAEGIYQKVLPYPQSSLLSGIVLGTGGSMDWHLWQALKQTGTLHLVAASGMNVTLIARVIIDLLVLFISRRKAYFVSLVIILIYCLLAGATPAVIRAGLMAGFSLIALAWGRETKSGWLLILALAVMLFINPILLFDISFQLSASAMAGMIWIRPILKDLETTCRRNFDVAFRIKLLKNQGFINNSFRQPPCKSPKNLSAISLSSVIIMNSLLDTFSAQIATFPVLYFSFGQFQPLAFLPNLMVIPLVPLLMMFGFAILICGLLWPPLAYPLAWLTWPALTYFIKIIEWWGEVFRKI
jgi:ComEC/Rec2-related protein